MIRVAGYMASPFTRRTLEQALSEVEEPQIQPRIIPGVDLLEAHVHSFQPAVLFLDLSELDPPDAAELVRLALRVAPECRIVAICDDRSSTLPAADPASAEMRLDVALAAGAAVRATSRQLQRPRDLAGLIRSALRPLPPRATARPGMLGARERGVLLRLAQGLTREEAAEDLGLTLGQVNPIAATLLRQLNARNMPHAVAIAIEQGLLPIRLRRRELVSTADLRRSLAKRSPLRILVCDDETYDQRMLLGLLEDVTSFELQVELIDRVELLHDRLGGSEGPMPDLVMLDLYHDRDSEAGTRAIKNLRAAGVSLPLLAVSKYPILLTQAEIAGADAVADKSDLVIQPGAMDEALWRAFREHASPTPPPAVRMSERDRIALRRIAEGATNDELARELALKSAGVEALIQSLFKKLDAGKREHLVFQAYSHRLLPQVKRPSARDIDDS